MLRVVRVAQLTVRLTGLLLLILGVLIWSGRTELVPSHAALGALFVLALWVLAILGFYSRAGMALSFRAAAWATLVLAFGILQTRMWPGPAHVYIRVVHLFIGIVAIGIGEMLAARIKKVARDAAPA